MSRRTMVFTDLSPKQKVLAKEMEKNGSARGCPRCGGIKFGLANGFIAHLLQKDAAVPIVGPDSRTAVVLICESCGAVLQHSLPNLDRFVDQPQHN